MPFTISHVAAVLPATRASTLRDPLVLSALVIGAISPDVPYFLPYDVWWAWGHTWRGMIVLDVPVTLVLVAIYWGVLAAPLRALAPRAIRQRLPRDVLAVHRELPLRSFALVTVAAAFGAFTHILWDAFTHEGRFGVMAVPWLQLPSLVGPLPAYRVLQYVSSVVGLAIVAWSLVRWYRRAPVSTAVEPGLSWRWQVGFAGAVVGATSYGWWSVHESMGQVTDIYSLRVALFTGLIRSAALVAVAVLVAAIAARVSMQRSVASG